MKTIFIYTAFCVGIFFSCQNNQKANTNVSNADCIENVLAKDGELGKTRNHECEKIALHKTINNYVEGMRNLNFSGCPEKFSQAFKEHIAAWDNMGEFTKRHSDLRGEMHVLFDSIKKRSDSTTFKPLLKAIWDTWADVEAAKPEP
ncbi:hypothetical protein [Winogradskyella sp.]|uniref:hypothetical protein n=1 Tax=Winogradskyella sp. TaxID=1883156 RepID=UPI003517EB34